MSTAVVVLQYIEDIHVLLQVKKAMSTDKALTISKRIPLKLLKMSFRLLSHAQEYMNI
jgi:hypothetical protein